jgi:hypothetical protein
MRPGRSAHAGSRITPMRVAPSSWLPSRESDTRCPRRSSDVGCDDYDGVATARVKITSGSEPVRGARRDRRSPREVPPAPLPHEVRPPDCATAVAPPAVPARAPRPAPKAAGLQKAGQDRPTHRVLAAPEQNVLAFVGGLCRLMAPASAPAGRASAVRVHPAQLGGRGRRNDISPDQAQPDPVAGMPCIGQTATGSWAAAPSTPSRSPLPSRDQTSLRQEDRRAQPTPSGLRLPTCSPTSEAPSPQTTVLAFAWLRIPQHGGRLVEDG